MIYIYISMHCMILSQPLLDWHLVLIVLVFVLVDLVILIPASVFESARLVPIPEADVEHMSAVNVSLSHNTSCYICDSL